MAIQISDGGATPHATDYSDLLAKFKTFILANGGFSVFSSASEEYFRLPGGGTDNIYFGMQKFADVPNDNFAWILQGFTGYVSGVTFHSQPGAIPSNPPALPLWNNTIPYWFVINGRRVIIIAKISSVYMSAYFGWIQPTALPSEWAYPLLVGGTTFAQTTNNLTPFRYSTVDERLSSFVIPLNGSSSPGMLCLRDSAGTWQRPLNTTNQESLVYNVDDGAGVWPYSARTYDLEAGWDEQEKTLDGQYTLQPCVIHQETPRNEYGELDGIFHVSGRGQAVENIVQRGGVDYLVVQNAYRVAKDQYFALKLQ